MFSNRRRKIHRRSLLAIGAGFTAMLSLPRQSHAFDDVRGARVPGNAHGQDRNQRGPGHPTPEVIDLKALNPDRQVASIRYADNSYRVTTVAGAEIAFQEFDLRFKTDASVHGPAEGQPVLLPASMRTDRAFIVFATPREMSVFIEHSAQHQT